jgi:integrase
MARIRGTRWQADALVNGVRVRKSFKTQLEALTFEFNPSTPETLTVGATFEDCYEHNWRRSKDAKDARRLTSELITLLGANTPVSKVTSGSVLNLIGTWRRKGNSEKTINRKLAKLSKCMAYAKLTDPSLVLPTIRFFKEDQGRIRFLTRGEEQAIFGHLPEPYLSLATFLLYTGCRWSEAISLKWSDMAGPTAEATVATFWDTKSGKPRSVPLNVRAVNSVYNDWTMPNDVGPFRGIVYDTFNTVWHKAVTKAGLGDDPQVVPHVLRHTCISRLVQGGVDIRRVKDWAGHGDIRTTMGYAHLAPNDLVAAAAILV